MTEPGKKARRASGGATQGLAAGHSVCATAALGYAKSYALVLAMALGLTVYVGVGLYNELRLCEKKPIPSPLLLEDHGYYALALNNALEKKVSYEVREVGKAFLYPPTALLVMEPFDCISNFFGMVAAYTAVNLALMVVMVWGVARCYGHSLERSWFLFPLALGFSPFLTGLHMGQINVITEFGIFLAFVAEAAMPVVAGAGLALAICSKVTPAAFLGYYLVNKRFKAMAATLIAVAVLCALAAARYGWSPFVTYARLFPSLLHVDMPGCLSLVARLGVEEPAARNRADDRSDVRRGARAAGRRMRLPQQAAGAVVHRGLPGGDAFPQHRLVSPLRVLSAAALGLDGLEQFPRAGRVVVLRRTRSRPGGRKRDGIGAYAHAFGQASMLLLLLWQLYEVCGCQRLPRGKTVRNTLAGLMTLGLFLGAAFSDSGKPGLAAVERGDRVLAAGDLDLAIAEYTQAMRLDPNASAYGSRAVAYNLKKDWSKAIADCTRAIQIDPKDARAYWARGVALAAGGDTDRAIAAFTEAIRLDPADPEAFRPPYCVAGEAHFRRGVAYASRGELDKAIADYDAVIRFNPRNADAYIRRGMAYAKKRERDKANQDFAKAKELEHKR